MTFLEYTQKTLREAGKSAQQVRWVGSRDGVYRTSWAIFAVLAAEIEYTPQHMNEILAWDLVIVGDTWWFEPVDQDNRQVLKLFQMPRPTGSAQPIDTVMTTRGTPQTIRRLNRGLDVA